MKLDIGGGRGPSRVGDDWVNMDLRASGPGQIVHDIDVFPWPLNDASVEEAHSSHCFEHLTDMHTAIREVARVCHEGAMFILTVPHPWSRMALCQGHRHTVSPEQVRHWCQDFVADFFSGCPRRLDLDGVYYNRGDDYDELRQLHPFWTEDQVLRLCPGACHEVTYSMTVIPNEVCP